MIRVLSELNTLRLEELDDEWVQTIYDTEFLEFSEFPANYDSILESLDIRSVFRKIMSALNEWLSSSSAHSSSEEKSWSALSHEVNHQKLLALLAYYIDYGGKNIMSHEHRNTALLASRFYFKMLSIPGYMAYHIYHSQLFAHSLGCLGYPKILCENEDNYFNSRQLTREVNSVIKEVAFLVYDLRAVIEALQLNPSDMNFEDILSNLVEFTGGAIVNKLDIDKIELANISRVIYEMIDIVLCDSSRIPNPDAIQLLFKCLLPKLVAASVDNRSANNLVRASYVTYSGLLLSKYGKSALSGYIILLQHLCYTLEGLERAEVRSARVSLVYGLMSMLPHKSYRYIVKWLLKLSTTSKVSHRHIALEMLAKLLNNDPEETSADTDFPVEQTQPVSGSIESESSDNIAPVLDTKPSSCDNTAPIKDVKAGTSGIKSNSNAKASETMNQEIQKEATSSTQEPNIEDGRGGGHANQNPSIELPENQDNFFSEVGDIDSIMADLLKDQDGLVIGDMPEPMFDLLEDTALSTATENQPSASAEIKDANIHENVAEVPNANVSEEAGVNSKTVRASKVKKREKNNTTPVENQNVKPLTAGTTDDESSQEPLLDNPDHVSEEDIAGLLRQRPHTVPHAALLRAVYERVHDVSSTLRTRALALLTDCLASDRAPMVAAVQELNGDGEVSRLMAIAARCVSDERAAVRRAAVSLVHRSLATAPAPASTTAASPQACDLGILVSLCRDASILVRSSAIAALGELVQTRPSDAVLDAFLTGPMHQMSDPETKVQEQVVTLIQQVAIDKLQKYSAVAYEDPLPWMFLASITRHNMRKHLQKACSLLYKTSSCINHRLVDLLSTHTGTAGDARSLQCLVMLTCVARHVDYSDIGFLLDYYYSLAAGPQNRDQRLMSLTLELLTLWSRYLTTEARTALRSHLVERLATSSGEDGCRIPCATLAAHLEPNDLQWATELLQLSERSAVNGGSVQEWLRAADLSLVAPVPPSNALLKLFLTALAAPPSEWSEEWHGATVAGMGRLCVRSRSVAAAAAPTLAALLHAARPLPARVNALLALADICTRYTCIVEPLMGSVCACLGVDAPPELRRTAARAITKLLLAGYLRLRTPLYYRYCALLADEDTDVREPAEYYVTCCLTVDAIYHHFVDCVRTYNDQNSESISFDARQLIYDVMLQRMSLVQKLNIQCRLAREVLQHAADMTDEGDGELSPSLQATLLDTITLLCGPRMKLPKKSQNQGEVADIDDLQERVTTNIVSHKMKRTVAEVLVPAVLRLYSRLRSRGGQIAAYLVRIATDLLNDYRHEIEELIENDEELVARVSQFQETIGLEPSFGNSRNLVTTSAPPEPETPRAPRRRAPRSHGGPPRKRALRI